MKSEVTEHQREDNKRMDREIEAIDGKPYPVCKSKQPANQSHL